MLKHSNSGRREFAAGVLGEIQAPQAVEPLIELLKDTDRTVQVRAAQALARIKDARAVEPLIEALKLNPAADEVIDALGAIGDIRAATPLIASLRDTLYFFPPRIGDALGKLGPEAVEPLIAALRDPEEKIRTGAARALGHIGDSRAVEPLIEALKNPGLNSYEETATALGKIKDARAIAPLISQLDRWADQPRDEMRVMVAGALGEIGAAAVEPLIAALRSFYKPGARAGAVIGLGHTRDVRAAQPLISALNDTSSSVRSASVTALGKIGGPAVDPLVAALKNGGLNVKLGAAQALGLTKSSRAVDPLISALSDPLVPVRLKVAGALSSIDDPRTIDVLTAGLKDDNLVILAGAHDYFIRKGVAGTEDALIRSLDAHGDPYMALDFTNSGNSALSKAGRSWIALHKYTLIPAAGSNGPRWGRR